MGVNMDGIILVNKPSGISSHDLVLRARRALNEKKIGHTGTLDPLAEGLMLLTCGKATKVLPFLTHHSKEYICKMQLGYKTDTLDVTGQITERKEIIPVNEEQIKNVLNSFLGSSKQIPPMYSAKKVNGVHLYNLARENKEIEREAIEINIYEIELLELSDDTITFRALCSTGTYIRSLVNDIAEKLENLATMTYLKRTKTDKFSLEEASSIDDLFNEKYRLISTYELLDNYRYIELKDPTRIYQGKRLKLDNIEDDIVMITYDKQVIAAYEKNKEDSLYYSKRGLW